MSLARTATLLAALVCLLQCARARSEPLNCSVVARTDKGEVCGRRRVAADGSVYLSFRGVPYAKQPLGDLRFQELQPAEPWPDQLDATAEGPVCPQYDTFYGKLTYPSRVMSEACIHANVHVPLDALPPARRRGVPRQPRRNLLPPHHSQEDDERNTTGLPILVFIHGGGFGFGSGDADLHGPEYLVTKGIIVITFNYRLNVFGFLSLNSSYIPGNNGLRDALTLLRWVQVNAAYFGGNPNDVTLAGQSAGGIMAHLLSMAPAADGLFNKMIILSGTASPAFFSASPIAAKIVADLFLSNLGINSTDPEDIHNQLVEMPLEKLMAVNSALQNLFGIVVFAPVIEATTASDFTTIVDEDPDVMIQQGRGNNIPLMMGFTTSECESFRPLFEGINLISRLQQNPELPVYPKLLTRLLPEVVSGIAKEIQQKYYPTLTMDNHVKYCTDAYFTYPSIKIAKIRADQRAKPTFLYQFSYENESNVMRRVNNLTYKGAAHVEDMTYWFRVNTGLPAPKLHVPSKEDPMVERMTCFISNFIHCSNPTCDSTSWRPVRSEDFNYQDIQNPNVDEYRSVQMTDQQEDMYRFFHSIENRNS